MSEIIDYIAAQRIGVISVEMLDGSPHSATVHFAHESDPMSIIILTDKTYRKCEPLNKNGTTRASFVTGFDEDEMQTMQMDGTVEFATGETEKATYIAKFPENEKFLQDEDSVLLVFKPTWWRYTNFKAPEGKQIISSDN